jgi:hypothetical protein
MACSILMNEVGHSSMGWTGAQTATAEHGDQQGCLFTCATHDWYYPGVLRTSLHTVTACSGQHDYHPQGLLQQRVGEAS